jgi:serine/threonine protein kinase
MEAANLLTGNIIAEKYQLAELLGSGGSGSTYRAVQLSDGATVAIKILSLRHLNDWKQLELFEREAQVLAQLSHPQIPQYLEYFHVDTPEDRAFYIVQQLAPGKTLTSLVQDGWLGTEAEIRDIASQLLAILQYLQGQTPPLIHRDIKPHNIVRNDDGQIFLVDFGAVQNVYHNTLMKGSTVAGTYGYMAPEQCRGAAVPASDLYGLGATILYLLTHRSPADLPQARLKLNFRDHVNIAPHFADWLETMLEPDTADRFASATIALQALQKEHNFRRVITGTKIGFPWKGAAAALVAAMFTAPLLHQYRYAFLTIVGLQPRDLCKVIRNNDLAPLNDYLNHGGSTDVSVMINDQDSKDQGYDYGSLLHCAIEYEQTNIALNLLKRGADTNLRNSKGLAPLHQVIVSDLPEPQKKNLLQALVAHNADVNATSNNSESPLILAIKKQDPELVRSLIKLKADPNSTDKEKPLLWHILSRWETAVPLKQSGTAVDDDAINKIADIAQQLVTAGVDINQLNQDGDTPLHIAVKNQNQVLINLLIIHQAKSDVKNKNGQTPLTMAIADKNIDVIKLLIMSGVDVNLADRSERRPLLVAIETAKNYDHDYGRLFDQIDQIDQDEIKIIDRNNKQGLEDQISDMPRLKNSQGEQRTTLEIVSALLVGGADPNLSDHHGDTPLHFLSRLQTPNQGCVQQHSLSVKLLEIFVRYNADPKIVNKYGDTALHFAVQQDFFPLIRQMMNYGWSPNQKNEEGKTALSIAASTFGMKIDEMKILMNPDSKSTSVNTQDKNGNTLLHRVLKDKSSPVAKLKIVKLFANAGANLNLINSSGHTALTTSLILNKKNVPINSPASDDYDPIYRTPEKSLEALRSFVSECKIDSIQKGGK